MESGSGAGVDPDLCIEVDVEEESASEVGVIRGLSIEDESEVAFEISPSGSSELMERARGLGGARCSW